MARAFGILYPRAASPGVRSGARALASHRRRRRRRRWGWQEPPSSTLPRAVPLFHRGGTARSPPSAYRRPRRRSSFHIAVVVVVVATVCHPWKSPAVEVSVSRVSNVTTVARAHTLSTLYTTCSSYSYYTVPISTTVARDVIGFPKFSTVAVTFVPEFALKGKHYFRNFIYFTRFFFFFILRFRYRVV